MGGAHLCPPTCNFLQIPLKVLSPIKTEQTATPGPWPQVDLGGAAAAAALEEREQVAEADLERLRSGLEDLFHLY